MCSVKVIEITVGSVVRSYDRKGQNFIGTIVWICESAGNKLACVETDTGYTYLVPVSRCELLAAWIESKLIACNGVIVTMGDLLKSENKQNK